MHAAAQSGNLNGQDLIIVHITMARGQDPNRLDKGPTDALQGLCDK